MSNHTNETDKELEAVLGSHKTRIRIVGTGGGGNNTVTRLLEVGIKGVDVIAINTDAQDLLYAKADKKILIGRNITNGLGAGSDPKKGEDSAKETIDEIEEALTGSDMVFVTCGLGGGTGTGSAPVIAEIAKKTGGLTIAVVTLPFSDEGVIRWENAKKGLDSLRDKVDTVIVVQNDLLLDLVPDMPLNAAFKFADEILVNAVKGITELVTEKGLVNLDFADVRTIMQDGGLAMIGLGETTSQDNINDAAQKALQNPLLDVDINGAKNALIHITGGQELSLKSAKTIMKTVAERLDPSAKIIWGARLDEAMGQSIRVMLIVTCLKAAKPSTGDIEIALKEKHMDFELNDESVTENKDVEIIEDTEAVPADNTSTSKKVFSEIFIEEAETDLSVMQDAANHLTRGGSAENEKALTEIKNACSSIHSSAELFDYDKISEFAELFGELIKDAIAGKFKTTDGIIQLFRTVPETLRVAIEDANKQEILDDIICKITNVLDLVSGANNKDITADLERTLANSTDDPEQTTSELETNNEPPESGNLEEPNYSNVKEAVKYFDKLF